MTETSERQSTKKLEQSLSWLGYVIEKDDRACKQVKESAKDIPAMVARLKVVNRVCMSVNPSVQSVAKADRILRETVFQVLSICSAARGDSSASRGTYMSACDTLDAVRLFHRLYTKEHPNTES